MIGKQHTVFSNDWKKYLSFFQWLEKALKKFPMIGNFKK